MRQNRGFSSLALPLTQIVMLALLLVNGEDNRLVNFISHSFFGLACICVRISAGAWRGQQVGVNLISNSQHMYLYLHLYLYLILAVRLVH